MAAVNFYDYAFISLGSNLSSGKGDSLQTLAFAKDALAALTAAPLLQSSIYVSSPVDSPVGTPDFYNAMIALLPRKSETPESLLAKMQAIETAADRRRSGIRNEARTLDLDLITFGREIRNTPELTLPHPRAHERRFVLEPMREIAGGSFVIPGMTLPLAELLSAIDKHQVIKKI